MAQTGSIRDKISFIKIEDDSNSLKYADKLMKGEILCIDFNDCPKEQAEGVLNFLSGVNYATDGKVTKISKNVFLFAIKEQYKDPDIKNFIAKYSK